MTDSYIKEALRDLQDLIDDLEHIERQLENAICMVNHSDVAMFANGAGDHICDAIRDIKSTIDYIKSHHKETNP